MSEEMDQHQGRVSEAECGVEDNVKSSWKLPTHICINCTRPFAGNLRGTNLLQIDFLDNRGQIRGGEEISVLKALDAVFHVTKDTSQSNAGMCNQCARVLSHIYTYYVNLMELAQPKAPVCKIVRQFKNHFKTNPSPQEVPYEYEFDSEGREDEEDELDDAETLTIKSSKGKVGRPRGSKKSSPRTSVKAKPKSTGKSKPRNVVKIKTKRKAEDSEAEPKPKKPRPPRKSYAELRQAESERTRRARMSETPDARAIRLFKDAERKRLQRRLLKDEESRKAGSKNNPGEESSDGKNAGEGPEDEFKIIGETLEQRTARLARDAECKRKRRALQKTQKAQGSAASDTSESNSNSSSRPETEVLVTAAPEFNYESLLHLAGIGV